MEKSLLSDRRPYLDLNNAKELLSHLHLRPLLALKAHGNATVLQREEEWLLPATQKCFFQTASRWQMPLPPTLDAPLEARKGEKKLRLELFLGQIAIQGF